MKTIMERSRWLTVVTFATAMAWVESSVVFYLRTMVDRIDPYQVYPLPVAGGLGRAEMVREAATLVMLLAVGVLAGRTWRSRLGYAAFAFGVWDLFYYVFLKVICGWPHSLLDWDVLFLLPVPWWGPVLAPASVAALMIVWGTLASRTDRLPTQNRPDWRPWVLNFFGICLALYLFMADTMRVAGHDFEALRHFLPTRFNWPLFGLAFALMAAPVLGLCRHQLRRASQPVRPSDQSERECK